MLPDYELIPVSLSINTPTTANTTVAETTTAVNTTATVTTQSSGTLPDTATAVNTTATAAAQSSGVLPDSTVTGVIVSFVSALLIYTARQWWEKRKLKRALIAEVKHMDGIESCAKQMGRVDEPPGRPIQPDDLPATNSIPTTIYENSVANIGLLGSWVGSSELEGVVEFYSKVLRYKGIIEKINNGDGVSDSDQEDLYDEISSVANQRQRIISSSSF